MTIRPRITLRRVKSGTGYLVTVRSDYWHRSTYVPVATFGEVVRALSERWERYAP